MDTLSKLRGTFAYSAPEIYFGERYSEKSDIYSMGILLWEMLYRVINQEYQRPYEEFPRLKLDWQIIHKTATENLRPTMPPSTPVPLATLIRQCIVKDQAGRPDAKEVLQELSQLHAQYRHSKSEWDAAIVGTKVGQAIIFPEASKPDLFSSSPSRAQLIPTGGTSAAVASTLSQETSDVVVTAVEPAATTTAVEPADITTAVEQPTTTIAVEQPTTTKESKTSTRRRKCTVKKSTKSKNYKTKKHHFNKHRHHF